MGIAHNQLAHRASMRLLEDLRSGAAAWAAAVGFTDATVYGNALQDWPRPDMTFVDRDADLGLALEFKPPGQTKREYLTGLGQAVAYLDSYQYAALVVPNRSNDGFEISAYIQKILESPFGEALPIALFSYDSDPGEPSDLGVRVALRARPGPVVPVAAGSTRQVFWAYWRDASQFDVFDLLLRMDRSAAGTFDDAFQRFWDQRLTRGKARKWDGTARKRYRTSYGSHKLNWRMGLVHCGLINVDDRLTTTGLELLQVGKIYGPDSRVFLQQLARAILEDGRHLELIFWVTDAQRTIGPRNKKTAARFYKALDVALQRAGIIQHVSGNGGKPTFLRDEQKLWNKLGLLVHAGKSSYFHVGTGLVFDWRAIIEVLGD